MPFYKWFMLLYVIPLSGLLLYQAIRGPGIRRWGIYKTSQFHHRLPVNGRYSRIFVGVGGGLFIVVSLYLVFFGETS